VGPTVEFLLPDGRLSQLASSSPGDDGATFMSPPRTCRATD
jgi:hypothetical protein